VRGVRRRGIAVTVLIVLVVCGCSGAAVVQPESSSPTTTASAGGKATLPSTASSRYCQRLDSGEWVTNVSAYSRTPCAPDPSYATGDEQADDAVAIPRCLTCTVADWERAEERLVRRAGGTSEMPDGATSAGGTASMAGWTAQETNTLMSMCEEDELGTCECLAVQLAPRVPGYQAGNLSADDPRVRAAIQICQPSEGAVQTTTSSIR
jgi:hypothetical protein